MNNEVAIHTRKHVTLTIPQDIGISVQKDLLFPSVPLQG